MLSQISPDRLIRHGFIALLVLLAFASHGLVQSAWAAVTAVDPQEIALSPADLASGFVIDAETTGVAPLPDNAGIVYRIDMKRQVTADTGADGPMFVQQMVARLETATAARELLAQVRDEIVHDVGLVPSTDGPNDGGTVSLARQDGDVTLLTVGFAKDRIVVFTTAGGRAGVTTFPKLMDLAGISSSRLDALLRP